MTTLISQLGNGADTIVIFGVLFADSTPAADMLIILTLAAMAVTFVIVGIYTVRHPALSKWVGRYAHRAMPFILIVVGVYVLANTASDLLESMSLPILHQICYRIRSYSQIAFENRLSFSA